jgi:hypothetical protein
MRATHNAESFIFTSSISIVSLKNEHKQCYISAP